MENITLSAVALIPSIIAILFLIIILNLYLLFRKYLKIKIKYYEKQIALIDKQN